MMLGLIILGTEIFTLNLSLYVEKGVRDLKKVLIQLNVRL